MTDTATQFVAHLKEENVLDAMTVIKTALSEQARAVVAKTQTDVAATFKLTEKAAPSNDVDTETDNADEDSKSDTDSVSGDDKEEKEDK